MKKLFITKNSVKKIQNLVVNHESQPIQSNPDTGLVNASFTKSLFFSTIVVLEINTNYPTTTKISQSEMIKISLPAK